MSHSVACQVTTLGNLLRVGDIYHIPPFQRNYAWDEEQFADFWIDISRTFESDAQDYLLGSIVLNTSQSPDLLVIDGQQRLTTASILISALRSHLLDQGHDALARGIENDFLARSDHQTQLFLPCLALNGHDKAFYVDYLFYSRPYAEIERLSQNDDLPPSNRLLARSFTYMHSKIAERTASGEPIETLARAIIDAFNQKLVLIRIDVQDDQNAFLLFEALNERGKELSKFDLLKNHLYLTSGESLHAVQSNWEIMSQNLEYQRTVKFIRHHWMSNKGPVSERDLFGRVKSEIRTPLEAENFTADLCSSSDLYSAFVAPDHHIWAEFSNDDRHTIRRLIERIELMGAEQLFIVLLAALETNRQSFVDILKMLTTFTFRYSTICGFGTANLMNAFVDSAKALRSGTCSTANDIFRNHFAKYYPDSSQFHSAFARKNTRSNAMARYILAELNDFLSDSASMKTQTDPFTTDLEHILPKKYDANWRQGRKDFPGGPERFVFRLGNMTLISTRLNQDIGNADFITKKKAYAQDCLDITKQILSEKRWTSTEIGRRQNWMASIAVKVWRYPV